MGKIEDSFTNHFKAIELMIELKLTSHDRFKKFLKTFKMTIDQALNKGIKKELMVEVYSMMSKLIEYDESMIEMMERLKRDI
jgi:predicted nucleic acid binding AN1-type Zn finger protein